MEKIIFLLFVVFSVGWCHIQMIKNLPGNLKPNPDYEYGVLKIAIKRSEREGRTAAQIQETIKEIEAYETLGNDVRTFV